jgi:AbrB family looped-hinge helix DNA binding protein
MRITMDGAGRLVLPKALREAADLHAGEPLEVTLRDGRIEIEPAAREVRIEQQSGFCVAEPVGPFEVLSSETVRRTRDRVRSRRKPG